MQKPADATPNRGPTFTAQYQTQAKAESARDLGIQGKKIRVEGGVGYGYIQLEIIRTWLNVNLLWFFSKSFKWCLLRVTKIHLKSRASKLFNSRLFFFTSPASLSLLPHSQSSVAQIYCHHVSPACWLHNRCHASFASKSLSSLFHHVFLLLCHQFSLALLLRSLGLPPWHHHHQKPSPKENQGFLPLSLSIPKFSLAI